MGTCWECGREDPRARGCCDLNTPGYQVCDPCYLAGKSEHRRHNHTARMQSMNAARRGRR